jgi:hypothetical protein
MKAVSFRLLFFLLNPHWEYTRTRNKTTKTRTYIFDFWLGLRRPYLSVVPFRLNDGRKVNGLRVYEPKAALGSFGVPESDHAQSKVAAMDYVLNKYWRFSCIFNQKRTTQSRPEELKCTRAR